MSDRRARHRDDEDFTVRTDPRGAAALDEHLRGLPRFSDLLTPDPVEGVAADDLSIPVEVIDDDIAISIAIDGLIEVSDSVPELELPSIPPPPARIRANTIARPSAVIPAAPDPDDPIAIQRAKTRPLSKGALAVRAAQLAAERSIAAADGRIPIDDRFPGQGSKRQS